MTEDRIVTLMNRLSRESRHCWLALSAGEKRVVVGMLNEGVLDVENAAYADRVPSRPQFHVVAIGTNEFLGVSQDIADTDDEDDFALAVMDSLQTPPVVFPLDVVLFAVEG